VLSKTLVAATALVVASLLVGCTPVEEDATSRADATEGKATKSKSANLPIACGTITAAGRCASASVLEVCIKPSESKTRSLVRRSCGAGEGCSEVDGRARCAPLEGSCTPGADRCTKKGEREECADDGTWSVPEPAALQVSQLRSLALPWLASVKAMSL